MASGREHDRATWLLALPFGLLWWPALGPTGLACAAAAFLLGGLWLSPDLDIRSNPTRRWGPLRWLWWPYRRLLVHRSLLSHGPLIGSAGRLLYLAGLILAGGALLAPLGGPSPAQLLAAAGTLWRERQALVLVGLAGVEASAWLHLIQDGDPIPRWRRRRR